MERLNVKFYSEVKDDTYLEIHYDEEINSVYMIINMGDKWAEIDLNRKTAVHLNKLMRKEISKIKTS